MVWLKTNVDAEPRVTCPRSWSRVWECWSWCWRVKLPNKRTDQIQTSEQLSSRQLEFCNDSSDFTLSKHVYLITFAIPGNMIHTCPSPSSHHCNYIAEHSTNIIYLGLEIAKYPIYFHTKLLVWFSLQVAVMRRLLCLWREWQVWSRDFSCRSQEPK